METIPIANPTSINKVIPIMDVNTVENGNKPLDTVPLTVDYGAIPSDTVNSFNSNNEVNIMADTNTLIPTGMGGGDMLGGGSFGGFLLGTLLGRGILGTGVAGAESARDNNDATNAGINSILHTLNGMQVTDSTYNLAMGQAGTNQNLSAATQQTLGAINSSNLNTVTSTLQGFNTTQNMMSGLAADINAGINNATAVTNNAITAATAVLDRDIHDVSNNIGRAIEGVRGDLQRSSDLILAATHNGTIETIKGQSALLTEIAAQGSQTRDLINSNQISDLERQLSESRQNHRHRESTDAIIINNNNNATAVANALAQQAQQQQMASLGSAVASLASHVNNQTSVLVGNRGNTNVTPTGVNL